MRSGTGGMFRAWVSRRSSRVAGLPAADGRRPAGPRCRDPVARSKSLTPRTATADRVAKSVCPYCAVGCGQRVYVKDEKVVQIEGDPDSPHSRGRLCPKGSASEQLVNGDSRATTIRYRAPYATEWSDLDLDTAMDMITDRVIDARRRGWQDSDDQGRRLNRTMGIASLGGRRWTTRRTTSSRSCSRPWARSRSRTKPAFDTPPRCPVWVPRSVAVEPPVTCRT